MWAIVDEALRCYTGSTSTSTPSRSSPAAGLGRGISAQVGDVTILNVYAPTGTQGRAERARFFIGDLALLLADAHGPVLAAGDWNCVLRREDSTGAAEPSLVLANAVEALDMVDVWTRLRPREPGYTFLSSTCSSRLDRIYASKVLISSLQDVKLAACAASDHMGVVLNIAIGTDRPTQKQRAARWQLDPATKCNGAFMATLRDEWQRLQRSKDRAEDLVEWWEKAKSSIVMSLKVFQARQDDASLLAARLPDGAGDAARPQRPPGPAGNPRHPGGHPRYPVASAARDRGARQGQRPGRRAALPPPRRRRTSSKSEG